MQTIRKAKERGHANHGWLDSHHTFSFADYYDPAHMGFSVLRVINEDRVAPGQGFGTHPHRDMEIISYVIEGQLAHKDSIGNEGVIVPGEVQRMSAGTGVTHSEFNPSKQNPVHFLQIWILPDARGIAPSYEQKKFDVSARPGELRLVASPDGAAGSVTIHQDARVFAASVTSGSTISHQLSPGRKAWLHVVKGEVTAGGAKLGAGDAVAFEGERGVELAGSGGGGEVLLFDLP